MTCFPRHHRHQHFMSTAGQRLLPIISNPACPVRADSILCFQAPPNPLLHSATLPIYLYPFRCSNWPSIICPSHDVTCPSPFFLLISMRILATPVISMIHFAVFLSLRVTPIIFRSNEYWVDLSFFWRFFVILQVPAPHVRTGIIQWLYTFCFIDSGKLQVRSWECLP